MTFSEAKPLIEKLQDNQLNKDYLIRKSKLCFQNNKKYWIVYIPFESINKNAKLMLVGITPGETQLIESYKKVPTVKTEKAAKKDGAFSGPLRGILIKTLKSIWPKGLFDINDCKELFDDKNTVVHSTSLLKDSVFELNERTGQVENFRAANKILSDKMLSNELETYFINESKSFSVNTPIICLGKGVFNVVKKLAKEQRIEQHNIIFIPHPSGANCRREYYYKKPEKDAKIYKQYQDLKKEAKRILRSLQQ